MGPTVRVATVAILGLGGLAAACGEFTSPPPAEAVEVDGGPRYPLFDHSVTWTGEEVIVVGGAGGDLTDGELVDDPRAWDPVDGFRPIATPPGPPRTRHAAVWTGTEVMIWSGTTDPFGVGSGLLDTAMAYDPVTDRWRTLSSSPPGLARVRSDAAVVDRTVVFAGGDPPQQDDSSRIGFYHLDTDRWQQAQIAGQALAVAALGTEVYVLWTATDVTEPGRRVPGHQLALGVVEGIGGAGPQVRQLELPISPGFQGDATLAVTGGQLAIWSADGDGAELWVAQGDPGDRSTPWVSFEFDDVTSAYGVQPSRAWLRSAGGRLAAIDGLDLIWIDPDDGSMDRERMTFVQHCALSGSGVAAGDRLGATGGWCEITDDRGERLVHGSFWFEPPRE